MSNFAFMPAGLSDIASAAMKAESNIVGDPRVACFHARFALETIVHWLYRHDSALRMPYENSLGALLHEPTFQNLLPEVVFQKARVILKVGNLAVHNARKVSQGEAMEVVRELHHLCYWLVRTFMPEVCREGAAWQDDRVPQPAGAVASVPRAKLQELEEKLAEQSREALRRKQEIDARDEELQMLRAQLALVRAETEKRPDTHDYSEGDTRRHLIDVDLRRAGWTLDQPRDREYKVTGMPNARGIGYVDYVLWGDDGKPLGVVEAKKTTVDPKVGQQQAKLYADCLEARHGQRPVIFYTNGYTTWMWDDVSYPERRVAGFYMKDELARLILRRTERKALDVSTVKNAIVERPYQKHAIGSIFEHLTQSRRKALLVMATGAGKTRTAIALVDALQRAGWVKRALFLADRISLVGQAVGAFKKFLPESSPVNLVTEKDTEGRVYVCTYPTMMGLIDETDGGEARFGVGYFDLVIIDEAHRSVYQRYQAIFRYFDSLLVGLTATPSEQVDKNTYELFDLEPGVPTDAYELEEAVKDGYLVPPTVQQVDLKFPREGIDYDSLSDEEKEQWESIDWGDEANENTLPDRVNAAAINNWLFNRDTVDKVLKHLMEHGHTVEGGDRLAKTIIFARNHDHAVFIASRIDHHYPAYKSHFARVIDHYETYAHSILDDFKIKDKAPHIAISVDMLDTGIDVPEVANLAFFKPVYSKIKFWQMIGRGTRLCPDLFGPEVDKQDFRVFDFCFNFDFFNENPKGIETGSGAPLGARLFRSRVQFLRKLQSSPELDPDSRLTEALAGMLHAEVAAMKKENFIVREHLEAVERFQKAAHWTKLSDTDQAVLEREVAGLPSAPSTEDIEARLFDLTVVRMQLAMLMGDVMQFESLRQQVMEIASMLEEKSTVPVVKKQLEFLGSVQDTVFWDGIDLAALEDLRLRLRTLVVFLEKKKRKVVYTDFQDEILGVRPTRPIAVPRMTAIAYERKVRDYLNNHLNDLVVHKVRSNQQLTSRDLVTLEQTLVTIGEDDGKTLLSSLLQRTEAPSLVHFIRGLVGMDRTAAHAAFSEFLSDRSLTPPQIRFIELIIDQLTYSGIIQATALYEPPFTDLHSGGPDALFAGKKNVIEGIFVKLDVINPKSSGRAG